MRTCVELRLEISFFHSAALLGSVSFRLNTCGGHGISNDKENQLMRLAKNLCLIMLFLCGLPFAALAQVGGNIDGTVTDPGGAVIVGAKVTATQVQTGFKITVDTTDAGLYAFPSLPEGPYTITVTQTGFKTLIREGLVVRVGLGETVD